MDEGRFTEAVVAAIRNAEIAGYFVLPGGSLDTVNEHFQIDVDAAAIRADLASPGGLKASHAQRRMLMILVTLCRPGLAQDLFGEDFSMLPRAVMAMDARNRGLFAELIFSYPGWHD